MSRPGVLDRVNENEPPSLAVLSYREREVLARVAVGQSNKTIADSLRIARPTVATYLARARQKLGREQVRRSLRRLSPFTLDSVWLERFTPAEQQVARLACEGLSNRTIAELLGRSVHTVANHLSRVYTKLGGVNRRALQAVLLEPTLHPPCGPSGDPELSAQRTSSTQKPFVQGTELQQSSTVSQP